MGNDTKADFDPSPWRWRTRKATCPAKKRSETRPECHSLAVAKSWPIWVWVNIGRFNYIMWVKQCHVYHPWLGMVSNHTTVPIKMVMTGDGLWLFYTHCSHIFTYMQCIEHIHRKVNTFFWHLFLGHVDPCPCWACTKMLVKYQWQIHPCLCNLMCFLL